jgi:hypothetical protein
MLCPSHRPLPPLGRVVEAGLNIKGRFRVHNAAVRRCGVAKAYPKSTVVLRLLMGLSHVLSVRLIRNPFSGVADARPEGRRNGFQRHCNATDLFIWSRLKVYLPAPCPELSAAAQREPDSRLHPPASPVDDCPARTPTRRVMLQNPGK